MKTRAQAEHDWFHGVDGLGNPAGANVGAAFRAGWNARSGGLFVWGDFRSHSGLALNWKIDCDALADGDVSALARLISVRVGSFSDVEGVPRGGTRLAKALTAYMTPPTGPLLIVDDVCTTGRSLDEHRAGREALGYVIFSRGGLPPWARALFTTDL